MFCDLFCALSNLALSLRALIVIFERVLDATSSEALLSMVIAFMSIDCDSESSLLSLSTFSRSFFLPRFPFPFHLSFPCSFSFLLPLPPCFSFSFLSLFPFSFPYPFFSLSLSLALENDIYTTIICV